MCIRDRYVYKDNTDIFLYDKYEDVPIITMLKKLKNKYQRLNSLTKKQGNNQNIQGKMIAWEKLLEFTDLLARKYEKAKFYPKVHHARAKERNPGKGKHLARFLMMGFFTVMPPDRQRTLRELVLGKTLKYGLFDKQGNFISAENLSNQENAKFYIHLKEKEYKTWRTYGEWIGEVNNKKFSTGKTYYDYLKQWLFDGYTDEKGVKMGWRDYLNVNNLDNVFFTQHRFQEYDEGELGKVIQRMIYGQYGIPTTPHTIRHIYDTHIRSIGMDEKTLQWVAYAMKHDVKEAEGTYTHLTKNQKLEFAMEAIQIEGLH